MKKILFSIACLTLFISFSYCTFAQLSFSTSANFESRYVWRGQPLGLNTPTIEPGASLGFKGFALDVWGAFSLNSSEYQELDWTLSWTSSNEVVKLMVTDYAFPTLGVLYHYFDYAAATTPHVLEAGVIFNVPKTNLSLSVYSNFYGNNARNDDGTLVYSTYVELGYAYEWMNGGTTFDFGLGCALNGKENHSFYGNDGFGVVNVSVGATKYLEITSSFKVPVFGRLIANPVSNKLFLVCGTTIEL